MIHPSKNYNPHPLSDTMTMRYVYDKREQNKSLEIETYTGHDKRQKMKWAECYPSLFAVQNSITRACRVWLNSKQRLAHERAKLFSL